MISPAHIALEDIQGEFVHKETGVYFQYIDRGDTDAWAPTEFDKLVFVGPNHDTRVAKVLKTVVYVIVDENDDGLVIEKWPVKEIWRR